MTALDNKMEREEVCSLMQAIPKQVCHTKLKEKIKNTQPPKTYLYNISVTNSVTYFTIKYLDNCYKTCLLSPFSEKYF